MISDEQLLERVRAGDRSALTQFYHRHQQSVYRLLFYLSKDPLAAEDLFQEVWLRVTRHLNQGKRVRRPRQWLMTIAANLCRDSWRRNRLRRLVFASPDENQTQHHPTLPAPDRQVEIRAALQRGLQQLSERQRSVFVLNTIEGFKIAEIAQILGVAEGTVKATLHAALKKLRHQLEEFHESGL